MLKHMATFPNCEKVLSELKYTKHTEKSVCGSVNHWLVKTI